LRLRISAVVVTARFGEALVITVHTGTVIITAALSFGRRGDVCLAVFAISAGSEVGTIFHWPSFR
jgi:hypothetical protein